MSIYYHISRVTKTSSRGNQKSAWLFYSNVIYKKKCPDHLAYILVLGNDLMCIAAEKKCNNKKKSGISDKYHRDSHVKLKPGFGEG